MAVRDDPGTTQTEMATPADVAVTGLFDTSGDGTRPTADTIVPCHHWFTGLGSQVDSTP